mmetsp:Transcript_954/g.2100  ORF Transcript_954/g.2100 Transcript_954/m.2100 type:complete len:399 (-) Transcript_954:80-1276(-)
MPVYEEKLISPFAIRFSQERIKNIFQDGRLVQEALEHIEVQPGYGSYDLVIQAPFPTIEVLRWCPRHHSANDGEHWFTLDNRRLYCLQKAAAAHWPKRVAAVVQVLYNDAGFMWRKYDSTTCGQTVGIGRCLEEIVVRWNWSAEVAQSDAGAHSAALRAVDADDHRVTVDALDDAHEEPDSLMAILRRFSEEPCGPTPGLQVEKERVNPTDKPAVGCPTPTTSPGSDDSDSSSEREAAKHMSAAVSKELLGGTWQDSKGETYTVQPHGNQSWYAWRLTADGCKFVMTHEEADGLVWWGEGKSHFLDLADVTEGAECVNWFAHWDKAKRKPRFTWRRPCPEVGAAQLRAQAGVLSQNSNSAGASGSSEESRVCTAARRHRRRCRRSKAHERASAAPGMQ